MTTVIPEEFVFEVVDTGKPGEYDLVIIGGGPAGLTAGIYGARAGLKTVILEKSVLGGQIAITDIIEDYPGFPSISAEELIKRFEEHARKFGAEIHFNEVQKLEKMDDGRFLLKTPAGEYIAKAVILATGANPRKLDVPGEKELTGRGVSYCAVCDGPFFKGKPMAVVGGGDSAFKEGLYLANLASKLYLIHRRDRFRAQEVYVHRARENPKIEFVLNSVVREIRGKDRVESILVENVKTGERREIPVAAVFIYVGMIPNTQLVRHLVQTTPEGYVLTDEYMRTNVPGLFAAGDVRDTVFRQVVTAAADAAIAAQYAEEYISEHFGR